MEVCRPLRFVRGKIGQTQRWSPCYPSRTHGIFASRVAALCCASLRRRLYSVSRNVARTSDRTPHSRPDRDFSYERLNWAANEVRLINLLPEEDPEANDDEKPLACSIGHFSLDDHPEYLALSYAWGDIRQTEPLILDGQSTKITKSLDTALRQLRRMMKSGHLPKRRVWADAVSIAQSDEVEKTWQVQKMGEIYRKANYVVVWLGPASLTSARTLEELNNVGRIGEGGDIHMYGSAPDFLKVSSDSTSSIGSSLAALFRRPWWTRIWAVQEFSFAKDVLFLCGDTVVRSQRLFKALELIKQFMVSAAIHGWKKKMYEDDYRRLMAEMSLIQNILRLFHIRDMLKTQGTKYSMWQLLALKRSGMQASDNRDLVYALTGLSSDAASKMMIYPDYSRDVKEIYIQTAKSFLVQGRLRLLWFCSQARVLEGLPSWVPDWSSPWQSDYRYMSGDSGYGRYGQSDQIFWAAGESRPVISFSERENHTLLHMQGHEFDTIDDLGSEFEMTGVLHVGGPYQVHLAMSDRQSALLELNRKRRNVENGSVDDVIRTMITDIEPHWDLDGTFRQRRAAPRVVQNNRPGLQLHSLYRHVGRRPFITSGDRLGLGPESMQRGDTVVVLFGAELPLVLRRDSEGYYHIIGEAYVHGVMDGEVMAMGLDSKLFDIR